AIQNDESTYCWPYNVDVCNSLSNEITTSCPSVSELTSPSPTSMYALTAPSLSLSHTSLSLATLSQLPSKISYTSSSQSPPSPPLDLSSIVDSLVSISHSSDFSLVSIQAPSATSSMPTLILSSASQIDSFSIQATSSMPTSILSSASQLDSFSIQATSSMPTLILSSASEIDSFSIQATSMPTSILSSASQIHSTLSMHILSSIPHSSNSGHTPLFITTMPAELINGKALNQDNG
uniref:Uncharacterized protein n=1 Tax=Amphimedon queenslandica TaxID=400682 RepID=A0A1X7TG43_AMPQE